MAEEEWRGDGCVMTSMNEGDAISESGQPPAATSRFDRVGPASRYSAVTTCHVGNEENG